jgi:hypothetical protein
LAGGQERALVAAVAHLPPVSGLAAATAANASAICAMLAVSGHRALSQRREPRPAQGVAHDQAVVPVTGGNRDHVEWAMSIVAEWKMLADDVRDAGRRSFR